MLSALLVALREGVEAALVVGIVLVYLNRTGRRALTSYVWGGVVLAVLASFAAAVLLDRWQVSEDGFEGLLMLVASALVVTMIIWMNRVARHLKKRNRRARGSVRAEVDTRRRMGDRRVCFPDGGARRRGTGADSARRGTFQRGRAGLDRHGDWDCHCRGRGAFLFSGHAANSAASFLRGHQRDSDGGGVSAGAYRRARAERSDVDLVEQDWRWPRSGPSCATKFSFSL